MREVILGAAAALVLAVVVAPSKPVRGRAVVSTAVSDNEGALAEVAIHFDPAALPAVATTYQQLLGALEPHVEVWVAVAERSHFDAFVQLLARWEVTKPERFHPVVTDRSITTWSRDRYLLLEREGAPLLLLPARPNRGHSARQNDWWAPVAIAETIDGVTADVSALVFDGGDFTVTDTHVFVTAVLLGRNEGGELGERDALLRWLRDFTGKEPVLIGDHPDDVPAHHIGMFVTPLDDGTVLVGDTELGLALLPNDAALPQPVDRSAETAERFHRVAREIEAAGFTVRRTPLVPLADGLTYLTWNNAVLERRADGLLHAYVPMFGVPALDAAGRAVWESEGVVVHPIDVRDVFVHRGTVRCLINVLKRS